MNGSDQTPGLKIWLTRWEYQCSWYAIKVIRGFILIILIYSLPQPLLQEENEWKKLKKKNAHCIKPVRAKSAQSSQMTSGIKNVKIVFWMYEQLREQCEICLSVVVVNIYLKVYLRLLFHQRIKQCVPSKLWHFLLSLSISSPMMHCSIYIM